MDQADKERRMARCYALWAAATNFRRHATDQTGRTTVNQHPAQAAIKALALTATLAAAAYLGYQAANGDIHPATLAFTVLAVVLAGAALADDVRYAAHAIWSRIGRRWRPGGSFRTNHGDPAGWDDDEYEAYFAITADQPKTARRNIHPAA